MLALLLVAGSLGMDNFAASVAIGLAGRVEHLSELLGGIVLAAVGAAIATGVL